MVVWACSYIKKKGKDRIFVTTGLQFKIAQAGMLANYEVLHLFQKNLLLWIITANYIIAEFHFEPF